MPATRHERRPGRLRAWREHVRANPVVRPFYRVAVAVAGLGVVAVGLVLVPYPGPGWLVVIGGVAIWATEFAWARRLEEWGLETLARWARWAGQQSLAVRVGIAAGTGAAAAVVAVGLLWMLGVPGWFPDVVELPVSDLLETYLPRR